MATGQHNDTQIHVEELRLLNSTSKLRAVATVKYGYPATTVSGIKVFERTDGRPPLVTAPQQQFISDGQKRYTDIIKWDWDLYTAIAKAVVDAYCAEAGITDPFALDDEESKA